MNNIQKISTFFTFVGKHFGKAEEAINFYVSLFKNSRIIRIERYGKGEPDAEGKVIHAVFSLNGQEFMAMETGDSNFLSTQPFHCL